MFIVKRFLKPHKRPKQFSKFEFKIQNRNLFLMITPLTARFQINIILIGIIKFEHRCWWRMLVTTGVDELGIVVNNIRKLSPKSQCHQHHFSPISNNDSFLFPKNWAHLEIQLDIYLLACVVCERDNNSKWQLFWLWTSDMAK